MKLSVIVPTLNEANSIVLFLKDIQYLRKLNHEIILVDAGSDDTIKLAKPWVDKLVHSEKGRAVQQNMGAKVAVGHLFLFLHADTHFPIQCFQDLEKRYRLNSELWGRFDVRLSGTHKGLRVVEFFMNLRSRTTGVATGDQAIFVSKLLFNQVGGFSNLKLMEDIDLSTKLRKIIFPQCSYQKVTTSSRRWEKRGVFKTIIFMWWYRLLFFIKIDSGIIEKKYYS